MKKKNKPKKLVDSKWIITIVVCSFFISLLFTFTSETLISNTGAITCLFVLLFFIFVGVIFDVIGIAVTASDEKSFYSMASKKTFGAKRAIRLKKNSEKVSSFCNDVIGDICGIVSGSAGVTLALKASKLLNLDIFISSLLITGLIAALTIGGKALGKGIAVKKATTIHIEVAKFISLFVRDK